MKQKNVFRNRNFVLTFLGAAVSNVGALFYSFAVSFWILELTDNNAVIQGAYLAATGLTFVLFSPVGGVICDRHNKARVMVVCDLLRGSLILAASLLILLVDRTRFSVIALFVAGVLGNVIGAIFSPASTALLPRIVEEERLQQANSYFSVLNSFQSIIGGILAAALYAAMPVTTLFFVVAGCYLLSGISEMFIRYDGDDRRAAAASPLADVREGFSYVLGHPFLLPLVSTILFLNFFFTPVTDNFFAYFLKTDVAGHDYIFSSFLAPEMWNSVFGACIAITSIVTGIVLSTRPKKERMGRPLVRWTLCVSGMLLFVALSYYLLVDRGASLNAFLLIVCVACLALGVALVNINVPGNTLIQILVDPDKLGKVSAILNMGSQGLVPVAAFLAGYAIEYLGTSALLFLCGGGMLAVSLVGMFNKRISEI